MTPSITALRKALARPAVWVSLIWLIGISVACAMASVLAPIDPLEQDLSNTFSGPSALHWLGSDELGRDIYSRLLHGGGGLLLTALIPVGVSLLLAVPGGLLAGYLSGRVDAAATFVVDILFALPGLVVVLAIAAVSDNNLVVMAVAFGVLTSGAIFRVVRTATAAARELPYVDAALVSRLSRLRILARHILPNVTGPLIVQAIVHYSGTFLFLTSLSFLGLGFSPETPSWGQMTLNAAQNLDQHPWLMVPVGFALTATVLALNLVGNALLEAVSGHRRPSQLPDPRRPVPDEPADAVVPPAPASVLTVDRLHVCYPGQDGSDRAVVRDVGFQLQRGEVFGLVGESGSGKTTTALSILGLVPPPGRVTSGRVLLHGEDLLRLNEAQLRKVRGSRIGLVAQEPMAALDPSFTVGSQLGEMICLHRRVRRREARQIALSLLTRVGLPDPAAVARRYPHQLSGGIAQRVAIALALSGEPDVLVADEPTAALDVTVQAEIIDLLLHLREESALTLLLVTHDLGVVADICDRVAVMSDGRLIEEGTTEAVLLSPAQEYTRTLVAATPRLPVDAGEERSWA
ncbi:dipeptide/oligopeptide/nickel ABC transporter permease/ATP-binding protein [Streptomyces fulvoviolaceus]|uniref:dipeptide/oligopeptide/nickel ABC transporter permease/ATP-binding protein n=1 Tax=Streptomyces fulvoviolaceus TaxID=285535 RepID=UPI000694E633|nr:dipeptide/oligopeptide/nickel ABC transporter permease/ATP-binding protein [Streptomyces fulvoviolaceus]